jgi:ABC-type multidrug transport system fused ATPase/permease subunit
MRKRILLEQKSETPSHVFEGITREDAEKDIPQMVKYLINYGFFRFGVEVCALILCYSTFRYEFFIIFQICLAFYVLVIGVHMDLFACLYVFWLALLSLLSRSKIKIPWTIAIIFNMLIIFIQCALFIGIPPSLCIEYPWVNDEYLKDFKVWALLPKDTFEFKERSNTLVADFILLLLMCQQRGVFKIESRYENLPVFYIGGNNQSILSNIEKIGTMRFVNPMTHDFTSEARNYLDILKRFFFSIFYWLTLAAVFLAGTSSASVLSFGYIIGSFIFLWQGTDFYMKPIRQIHNLWNRLIAYNILVIFLKTYIQLVGCLLLPALQESTCWLVQIFAITCLVSRSNKEICSVASYNSLLVWDGICFLFLIFQKRIFSSDYFIHIIMETKAGRKLASR